MKRLVKIVVLFAPFFSDFSFAETIHIVKKGETLFSISRSYDVSVDSIRLANSISGNTVRLGQNLTIPDLTSFADEPPLPTHTVLRGETLYSISRSYGITVSHLREINNLESDNVRVGQKLVVPEDKKSEENSSGVSASSEENPASSSSEIKKSDDIYYTVKEGDTWLGIAIANGLTLSQIREINKVSEKDLLKVGQRVKIADVPDLKDNDPHIYAASLKKGDTSLVWPVKASDVTYVNGKISAVALSASKNESVKAIMAGTVMVAGSYRGYGNVVFIQSKTGHIYAYTGLGSVRVSKGDYVVSGGEVGTAGIDAYSQNPQVTLMVFQNSQPIDPAKAPRG